MTPRDDRCKEAGTEGCQPHEAPARRAVARSHIRYGTTLRFKLVAATLLISCLVVGSLFWFAFASLHSSIRSIYEQRARSVAALISKSIREKDYVLYYSDELDAEIRTLLARHESILGISVVGTTARGLVAVASTDPTMVGQLVPNETAERYEALRDVAVEPARVADRGILRAYSPITSGAESAGLVIVDMSLSERDAFVRRLSWTFAAAAVAGFLLLGSLIYLALTALVTRPVQRLARAAAAITQRDYSVDAVSIPRRVPGLPVHDEVCLLEDSFQLMSRVIQTHEQELRKLVVLDDVTGLYNAAHFRRQLALELAKGKRYKHATSLLVVDIGGLSGLGSSDADRVRVRTASFLLAGLRHVDILFRISPDRLAALLPETPQEGASKAADRIRAYVGDVVSRFSFPVTLTIASMGWAADDDAPPETILQQLGAEAEGSPE